MSAEAYINTVLTALSAQPVRNKTNEWEALCPAHGDKNPSLGISLGKSGNLLLCCRSQHCDVQQIVSRAGLKMTDLYPPKAPDYSSPERKPEVVARYDYTDESGELLFQVLRWEPGFKREEKKTFTQQRPDGRGGWEKSVKGVRQVLYRLPDVERAKNIGATIFLAEGEKDVENLRRLGVVATCNSAGAEKWAPGYTATLTGADVVMIPDNDGPGRKHRDLCGSHLAGRARSFRVLNLPSLPDKGDASDWIAAGGTREELLRLAALAEEWTGPTEEAEESSGTEQQPPEWIEPVPFGLYRLPKFPVNALLPRWLREYVVALAETTQTPVDMAGVFALTVCAVAVAKVAEISCGPAWAESLNLYAVISMPSGSRKSSIVGPLCKPIEEFEEQANEIESKQIAEALTQRDIMQGRLQKLKSEASTAKTQLDREELENTAVKLAGDLAAMPVPSPRRLLADDITPERLSSLMGEQGGRIGILSSEGDTFDLISGRYSDDKARLGVYLKAHCGETLRVDRSKDNRAVYVHRPALTLGLTVQPDVLRGLAQKQELRGRGLIARFLYSLPESNIGYRSTDYIAVPDAATGAYRTGIWNLLDLKPEADKQPHMLQLSPEACSLFTQYRMQVEKGLRPDGDMAELQDWGSKCCGAVARLMGILHLAERGQYGLVDRVITRDTADAALQLGNYFIEHAKAAYTEMGADAEADNARYLLAWVERSEAPTFTRRDAHYNLQGRFKRAADLDKPLEILTERGYIREQQPEFTGGRGRKPSTVYVVNPVLLKAPQAMTQLTVLTQIARPQVPQSPP